jgi:hypothetical protein
MAFTEEQKLKIVRIFAPGLSADKLDEVLTLRADRITAEVESQVGALITEYFANNVNRNATVFEGTESNKGFNLNPDKTRSLIKRELAVLLYLTDCISTDNRLIRG